MSFLNEMNGLLRPYCGCVHHVSMHKLDLCGNVAKDPVSLQPIPPSLYGFLCLVVWKPIQASPFDFMITINLVSLLALALLR
jgi:hypothetical protein